VYFLDGNLSLNFFRIFSLISSKYLAKPLKKKCEFIALLKYFWLQECKN
jgi:hypothetical protein